MRVIKENKYNKENNRIKRINWQACTTKCFADFSFNELHNISGYLVIATYFYINIMH